MKQLNEDFFEKYAQLCEEQAKNAKRVALLLCLVALCLSIVAMIGVLIC